MARNDGIDRTTVRNVNLTKTQIANVQHHNEREKSSYVNQDIVLERADLNIHFKEPSGDYDEMFQQMKEDGIISTRGLQKDAKLYGELIFDVNSAYFYNHGGYDFAKKYYEDAYKAAIEIVGGEQYILSAVMHADERNKAMSEALGTEVYHYHMHVVYVPVVEKQVLWTKRCKDPALVGTVKETIMQVSSSKKWESKPALDENGELLLQKNGKAVLKKSYSLLQDDYYHHMRDAGYTDLERGERGSTEEHLTVTQFKVEKEKERLKELQMEEKYLEDAIDHYQEEVLCVMEEVNEAQAKLDEIKPILHNTETLAKKFSGDPKEFLPEAGTLESGKTYREKKAIPMFKKITEVLQSLNQKYWDLKNRFHKLQDDYSYERERCESLVFRNNILEEQNKTMKESLEDYKRVQKFFGPKKIAHAIGFQKQKEAELRRQRRKNLDHGR